MSFNPGNRHLQALGHLRINLAAALRLRRDWAEAQRLLDEAETISDRHHFKDFIGAIARNRNDIEKEQEATQLPVHTLPELLDSLGQLLRYKAAHAQPARSGSLSGFQLPLASSATLSSS